MIKRYIILIVAVIMLTVLSSCALSSGTYLGIWNEGMPQKEETQGHLSADKLYALTEAGHVHTPITVPAVEATCTSEGKTSYTRCAECGVALTTARTIQKKNHVAVQMPSKPATCTEDGTYGGLQCSVCGTVISNPIALKKTGHRMTEIPAVAPTCTSEGLSAGVQCAYCGLVEKEQEIIPKNENNHEQLTHTTEVNPTGRRAGATASIYCSLCNKTVLASKEIPALGYEDHRAYDGYFGYYFLSCLPEPVKLCSFYKNLDANLSRFHNDTKRDVESNDIVTVINFKDYGITKSQAIAIWTIYRADHPLYYWISNGVGFSDSQITIYTSEEFRLGSERENYNRAIYDGIKEISKSIPLDATEYETAKILHDHIIIGMDYAYDMEGNPEEAVWAHSIIGFFVNQSGVCETYAKVFHLMLNYFEVDSIYVTGDAGDVAHAWNMAKMDDGEWYWFDLTWDDDAYSPMGISYDYFCVTDAGFTEAHVHTPSEKYEVNFSYTIPECATSLYVREEDRIPDSVISTGIETWEIQKDISMCWLEKQTGLDLIDEEDERMSVSEFARFMDKVNTDIKILTKEGLLRVKIDEQGNFISASLRAGFTLG